VCPGGATCMNGQCADPMPGMTSSSGAGVGGGMFGVGGGGGSTPLTGSGGDNGAGGAGGSGKGPPPGVGCGCVIGGGAAEEVATGLPGLMLLLLGLRRRGRRAAGA